MTVVIPVARDKADHPWLAIARASFPPETPVIVVANDGPLEVGTATNEGVKAAQTEWVLPFGYDDMAHKDLIPTLLAAAWDADVVYPSMALTDEAMTRRLGVYEAAPFCGNRLQVQNYITGASLIRRDAFLAVGGIRDMDSLEDWDLMVRLHRAGYRLKPCPEAAFAYRQVAGSRNKLAEGDDWLEHHERKHAEIVGEEPRIDATFYHQATPATTYWRCQLPARYLPGQTVPILGMKGFRRGDEIRFPTHRGAAVFQFPGSVQDIHAIGVLRDHGYRVLVEADDNYLDDRQVTIRERAGWGVRKGDATYTIEGHRECVETADGVLVASEPLADMYSEHSDDVTVCPNAIDPDDWDDSWEKPDDVFRIGWWASYSHDVDEPLVRQALSWASRQPGVEVIVMGLKPGWSFTHWHISFCHDIRVYFREMSQLHVGVAPVTQSSWASGRSDLKALEYGMAGALPIMSTGPTYHRLRDAGVGLHAGTAKDFYDHVKWCVRNQDAARELARQANAYVRTRRTMAAQIHSWQAAVRAPMAVAA